MILVCPAGAYDYPISHGPHEFRPYRLDHTDDRNPEAGPWLVDVPDALAQYFLGQGGFFPWRDDEDTMSGQMVRLRKVDGGDASIGFLGEAFPADADGTVLVPTEAAGVLCESHGFEVVPDEPKRRRKVV